jgi:hypothetical protein
MTPDTSLNKNRDKSCTQHFVDNNNDHYRVHPVSFGRILKGVPACLSCNLINKQTTTIHGVFGAEHEPGHTSNACIEAGMGDRSSLPDASLEQNEGELYETAMADRERCICCANSTTLIVCKKTSR